jgi:hypothetical protein
MAADEYPDPLQYLNGLERRLVGWSVTRQFATNVPRTARWIRASGPHAVARVSCAQTFAIYIWLFVLPGVAFATAELPQVATVLYALAGACAVWAFVCIISAIKPREYRRARGMRDATG